MANRSKQLQLFQKHKFHIRQISFVVDLIRIVMLGAFIATGESFLRVFWVLVIFIQVLWLAVLIWVLFPGDTTMRCCGRDMGKGQRLIIFRVKPWTDE